ncbi:HBR046Cp [Eremothecium sinecaudum]|uniref:HBR046Cp n=1 Tax=Eremothecium sinecaudum TaxID=45286 RepID=A0A120K130_9SACH|nr:HBR046Cp [Eremothecium sinecaudum]AMD18947.1 HBR046Cp [Eremothecium sinecaudum]
MYLSIRDFHEAYSKIVSNSSTHSSCRLVIFVSCLNIDALCATKMLVKLLRKQLVQQQLVPIFGYSELLDHFLKLDENICDVILVGCGGMIDLEMFLQIDAESYVVEGEHKDGKSQLKRNIYVLDCHRPWNLDNLFGSMVITCFDDGTIEGALQKEQEAYAKILELEGEIGEYSYSDSELEYEQDDAEVDSEEQDEDYPGMKRVNDNANKGSRKHRKKQLCAYEKLIEEYYSRGTTVSNSLAVQVYSLISSVGETNLEYIWLTILGVTSLDTIYPHVYEQLQGLLKDEVRRLSPHDKTKTPDKLSIDIQPDYLLFLLRHSSLYDSFYYSNYVNAKFSLWKESGKKRLHKMLARMGIPLSTAQEHWLYMDNGIKKQLGVIFEKNLDRYGLQDIVRDGFVRTFGYRGSISASEFVEAIVGLLEMGKSKFNDPLSVLNDPPDTQSILHGESIEALLIQRQKRWISNFWTSWDSLDDDMGLLKLGIENAQFLQKAIFSTGVAVLEKRIIKHLRIYRLCVLQDGPYLPLFRNPLTLLRLGNWLIEYFAEFDDKQLLPIVLASLDSSTGTYLVAGLAPRYPRGMDALPAHTVILNNFNISFQQIAQETGAKVRIDNFESSIIEITKDDLQPFLEKLTLSGLI